MTQVLKDLAAAADARKRAREVRMLAAIEYKRRNPTMTLGALVKRFGFEAPELKGRLTEAGLKPTADYSGVTGGIWRGVLCKGYPVKR